MFKWLAFFFSNDVFLKNILFLDVCYCKLNRLQYSVNTTFICTGKQKNLCDSLYCDTQFMVLVGTEAALSLRSADTRVLGLPFNNLFFHFIIFLNFLFCRESCSVMSDSLPPHGLQHTGLPFYHQLLELAQTHVHRVGDAIQPSPPLLCPSPPASIFPSIRIFSNESVLHIKGPKYWVFRTDFL